MFKSSALARVEGFSLIEVAVTLVIVGILAALAAPQIRQKLEPAREIEAPVALQRIATLQQLHRSQHGGYADTFDELDGDIRPVRTSLLYVYRLSGDAETFTACASPQPDYSTLKAYSISEGSVLAEMDASDCTGNP